jgi:acyl carrier protein
LHDPFGLADDHIAPRTETEKAIAAIWRDALGLERVGVRDNFFDLGGHSLLAVRAIVRLEKAIGARLNQAIMVLQTLEQIAAEIDRTAGQSAPAAAAAADAVAPEPPATAPEETTSRRLFQSIRNVVGGKNR